MSTKKRRSGWKNPQREPVAQPAQTFGGTKIFDFRRITLLCLKKRLSFSAVKRADMSELQSHHCMFEQIK